MIIVYFLYHGRYLFFMKKSCDSLLIFLVGKTKLFDINYYKSGFGKGCSSGKEVLHYINEGDEAGCFPMPLFDPAYYRKKASSKFLLVNSLLHYCFLGRYYKNSPCNWFDTEFYLRTNKDVKISGENPLLHYVRIGAMEGRSPCKEFDGAFYLRKNRSSLGKELNPLIHYLNEGFYRRLPISPGQAQLFLEKWTLDFLLDLSNWEGLISRCDDSAKIDVIIPIYKGCFETLACIYSVLSSKYIAIKFELLVINDDSPNALLVDKLRELSLLGLFTLLENKSNKGFVGTVNYGAMKNPDRDIVLLNADTEVYDFWLERLYEVAYKYKNAGTITPLSNNATICSYPLFLEDNFFPLELSFSELDALAAKYNAGCEIETPTGVGFCLYIRRKCLDDVGFFDEQAFGKGYGEENDLCQRAIQKSWRNFIAPNVFVLHRGSVSFQNTKENRVKSASMVLRTRFPSYRTQVENFIKTDFLSISRRSLDRARLKRMSRYKNTLIVCHNRGGGTERHIRESAECLIKKGYGVYFLRPNGQSESGGVAIGHPLIANLPNLEVYNIVSQEQLSKELDFLGITEVHIHSLIDFHPESPTLILKLIDKLTSLWTVSIHDYEAVCPRINLVDFSGSYCYEAIPETCNKCIKKGKPPELSVKSIDAWRDKYKGLLSKAPRIICPDQDVVDRLQRYFPDISTVLLPHEEFKVPSFSTPVIDENQKLNIVVIGAISKVKGNQVLLSCALDAKRRGLPIEFVVMGYAGNARALKKAGVHITGRYLDSQAYHQLDELASHACWFPSIWPETYSYTLSVALKSGLPVFAFDIGAIASRLGTLGRNKGLLSLNLRDHPSKINDFFVLFRSSCLVRDNTKVVGKVS